MVDAAEIQRRRISVVLADDHKAFREGLASLLRQEHDIEIVGTACNGLEAAKIGDELKPDVLVIDVSMPELGGIEAIRRTRMASPTTNFVVLSAFSYDSYVAAAIDVGASAYLLKTEGVEEIVQAIRSVYNGQMVFGCEVNKAVRRRVGLATFKSTSFHEQLSPRELQLLILAGQGLGSKEIACRFGIGERTVQTYFYNVQTKLGTTSRIGAVVKALAGGWITFEELDAIERQD